MQGLYLPSGPINKNKVKQVPTKIVGDVSKTPGTQIPPAKPLTTKPQRMALNKTPRKGSVSGQDRNPYEKKQDGGSLSNIDNTKTPFTLEQIRWLKNNNYNFDKLDSSIPLKDRITLLNNQNHGVYGGSASADTLKALAGRGDKSGIQTYIDFYSKHSDTPQPDGSSMPPEAYTGKLHLGKKQIGGKFTPMNESEAMAGSMPPPMIPSTKGDRIRKGLSDVATGVATWGTSFRPPTSGELQQGRGTWADRAKLLAGAATQGLANEMIGAGIGKIAGKFIPKPVTQIVPKSESIDVGSRMYNRQNVTNEMAVNAPMNKDLVDYLNGLSHEGFAKYAKDRGGYTNIGRYFTVTPSGRKNGGLLKVKK